MTTGDTFSFPGGNDVHVWTIISDPAQNANDVLMVHFATWDEHWDQSCILLPGDHPFIRHKTVVCFDRARAFPDATYEALKADRRMRLLPSLSPQLLGRIRQSAFHSRLKRDWVHLLIDQGLIDVAMV